MRSGTSRTRAWSIETGARVESIDALLEQGYDAVLVAVGVHKGQKLRIPGADSEGVLMSTEFLQDVNLGERRGRRQEGGGAGRRQRRLRLRPGGAAPGRRRGAHRPVWSAERRCRRAPTRSSRAKRRASSSRPSHTSTRILERRRRG